MEEIEKARKNLTINTEIKINVEAIEGEIDFVYIMTRKKFEELVSEEIKIFTNEFKSFYDNVKKYEIFKIEIGGQLMRTPILGNIILKITNKSLSKTIALDECHSLGSLFYGLFILDKKKFEELESVKSYNLNSIYYSINNSKKQILIKKGENYTK
jgi:molecular chaperone DnaK (HSP70)